MYLLPLVITFLFSASVAFYRSASKINHAAKSRNHYSHSWHWVLRAHPWTHHGIVAYFEAGGLGQTPMNLQTDRPTEEEEKSPPPTHGSSPRETERLNQLKVREEKFLVKPRFTSLARKKTTKTTTKHQMWDSDWSWQARSTTVSPLSSLPLHTNQEIVEVCFFIPLLATPFAGVDACVFCFLSSFLFHEFWLLKPDLNSEVSRTRRRGEDLHSGRTMRWVKRLKSLHLHCVSRLHFVFRPLVSTKGDCLIPTLQRLFGVCVVV